MEKRKRKMLDQSDNAEAAETPKAPESEDIGEAIDIDFQALAAQIERLTTERDQLQQQVLRTMADFQNYRRRSESDVRQFRQIANENLVLQLLPVLDNFERTLAHLSAGASVESVMGGIQAVERQLRQVLDGQQVKRIEVVGAPFDPEIHEAIGADVTDEAEPDTVTMEIEAGYQMGDRVIRAAKVRVAKRP